MLNSEMDMDFDFKEINTTKLSKEVVNQILDSMKSGLLRAGDKMPSESELTKIFNVSRGTIREALKSLENFGLISIKSGSGTYVKELKFDLFMDKVSHFFVLSKNEVVDLTEIRKILEVYGVELAAKNATHEDIEKMDDELHKMEEEINNGEKFIMHDLKFHLHILECSKNVILPKLIDSLRYVYLRQSKSAVSKKDLLKRSAILHRKIFNAIKNKDSKEAKSSMLKHLEDISASLINEFK